MSQDTLNIFPEEVAAMAAAEAAAALAAAAARPPLPRSRSLCGSVAKASFVAALHNHAPLRNPWVGGSRQCAVTASESFDCFSTAAVARRDDTAALRSSVVASGIAISSSLHFSAEGNGSESEFSVVTEARSRIDGVRYALKKNRVAFESVDERMTALQEVFGLSLGIDGVIRYFGAWWENGGKFLVCQTEWVEGGGVRGQLEGEEVLRFGRAVSGALERMHARGAVHLDVKPENVFFREKEGGTEYLLGDFGLVRKVKADGSVDQISSEEAGWVDGRSLDGDGRYLCPEAFDISDDAGFIDDDDDFGSSRKRPSGGVRATARPAKRRKSRLFGACKGSSDEDTTLTPSPEMLTSARLRRMSALTHEDDSEDGCTPRRQFHFGGLGDEDDEIDELDEMDEMDEDDIIESPVVIEVPSEKKANAFRLQELSPMRQMPPPPSPLLKLDGLSRALANTPRASRNLMAADIFSLGVSLFEVATGYEPATSGPDWHWVRNHPAEVAKRVVEATGSRPLARIVESCLARNLAERPSAASVAASFAAIGPVTSEQQKAVAEIAELKKSNELMRIALERQEGEREGKKAEKMDKIVKPAAKGRVKRNSGIQRYMEKTSDVVGRGGRLRANAVSPLTATKPAQPRKNDEDVPLMPDTSVGAVEFGASLA